MSLYIRINSKGGVSKHIKKLVPYALDYSKTEEKFCHTIGVGLETACEDMLFIQHLYGKTGGREVLHWVVSHDEGVSAEIADRVAVEVLQLLKGQYQVVAATHLNTNNRHTHFVINPVDVATGKKFNESKSDMQRFRDRINEILRKYNLKEIGTCEDMEDEDWEQFETDYDLDTDYDADCWNDSDCYSDNTNYYSVKMIEDNQIWTGLVSVTNHQQELKPGVLYTYNPYVSNVLFTTAKIIDGKVFRGTSSIENGRTYEAGMLYEDTNAFVITQKAENGKIYQGFELYEGDKRYISGFLKQIETEDSNK